MEKKSLYGKKLLTAVGILITAVLCLAAMTHNTETKSRENGSYGKVGNVTCEKHEDADAPAGVVYEYRFVPDVITHTETLAFFINHHEIAVYLEEECVYRLEQKGSSIQTTGGIWVMLPLYEEDAGKEVRVVLSPLYGNYQNKTPDFLLGSELAIYKNVFLKALPELLLGLANVLAGVFLLGLALYHSMKGMQVERLYAIGTLAASAGVWRMTYGRFFYLLFEERSVLLYNISVVSLMVVALSMLYAVKSTQKEGQKNLIRRCSHAFCVVYLVQLILQLAGIVDLRYMLTATHLTIVISAVLLFLSGTRIWGNDMEQPDTAGTQEGADKTLGWKGKYPWILGIGVLTDLLLYYFAKTSVGMLFTLTTILIFCLLEGVGLLNSYAKQKTALEEMEMELTLSRTTTMMSQIRSHFVFNLLNAISGMCKYDPEKADDTVVRFARYLRNNIDIMENDKNIPFETDLKQLEDYVALEQVRFGDKVEFYTDIETMDFMIPPLILQPVVENAIKHGISKKKGNGTIILRTRKQGETVIITVEDDGIGFDMAELDKEKSVGLRNIRFRLEHLVNGTFAISSEVNKGTVATITIPKNGTGRIKMTK